MGLSGCTAWWNHWSLDDHAALYAGDPDILGSRLSPISGAAHRPVKPLPPEWGQLASLQMLDLWDNQLTGCYASLHEGYIHTDLPACSTRLLTKMCPGGRPWAWAGQELATVGEYRTVCRRPESHEPNGPGARYRACPERLAALPCHSAGWGTARPWDTVPPPPSRPPAGAVPSALDRSAGLDSLRARVHTVAQWMPRTHSANSRATTAAAAAGACPTPSSCSRSRI